MSKRQSNPTPKEVGAVKPPPPPPPPISPKTLSDIEMANLVVEEMKHSIKRLVAAIQPAIKQYCETMEKISKDFYEAVNLKDT